MEFIFGITVGLGIAIFFPKTFTYIRTKVIELAKIAMDK